MRIYAPVFLATKYETVNFQHKISSFGKVPYGHSIMGNVKIPYPETGCGKSVKVDFDSSKNMPMIILVVRGECSFLEKALNAQTLKASLVIIVDNVNEEMSQLLPWAEDAPQQDVRIPSIVVEKSTGMDLLTDVRKLSADRSTNEVIVAVSFKIQQSATSNIIYKFNLNSRQLYEAFFELLNFYPGVKSVINVIPSYQISPASSVASAKPFGLFCLNGTAFCERREDQLTVEPEDQPLFESMRQICLSRISPRAWWEYVGRFYLYCQKINEQTNKTVLEVKLAECSKRVMFEVEAKEPVSAQLEDCMKGVDGNNISLNSKLHTLLIENYKIRQMMETPIEPAVMINGQIVYGRMTSLDLLKEICASLLTKPDDCKEIDQLQINKRIIEMNRFSFGLALVYLLKLVLIGAVVTGAFYIIYKIILKRELEKKTVNEIDSSLFSYYTSKHSAYEGVKTEAETDEPATSFSPDTHENENPKPQEDD